MHRRFTVIAAAQAICLLFGVSPRYAQAAIIRPLAIKDALSAPQFEVEDVTATLSPDGTQVAYLACDPTRLIHAQGVRRALIVRTGAGLYSEGCDLFVQPTAGGRAINVTKGLGDNWGASWSPNGKLLGFCSTRGDGFSHLWVWSPTMTLRRVSRAIIRTPVASLMSPIQWFPDSSAVIVSLHPPAGNTRSAAPRIQSATGGKGNGTTLVLYRSSPLQSSTNVARSFVPWPNDPESAVDVAQIELRTGDVRRIVSSNNSDEHWLSPDGKYLAYVRMLGQSSAESRAFMMNLRVVDLATNTNRSIVPVFQQEDAAVSWSPDSHSLAYISGEQSNSSRALRAREEGDAYIVNAKTAAITKLQAGAARFDRDFVPAYWSSDGKSLFMTGNGRIWRGNSLTHRVSVLSPNIGAQFFLSADGSTVFAPNGHAYVETVGSPIPNSGFAILSLLTGTVRQAYTEPMRYGGFYERPVAARNADVIAYRAQAADKTENIWAARNGATSRRQVSDVAPRLDAYHFGKSRIISFTSRSGEHLHAAVLLPADYVPGRRYPTMFWVYASDYGSGNANNFGLAWGEIEYNLQMLATRGYAVVAPDIPVHVGTPMRDLADAVLPAIDAAAAAGITDPNRVGVEGQSNGGYSTLSLIVQTHRFKAAVMNSGFGDLTAFYGAMDPDGTAVWVPWLEFSGGAMGVAPWQDPGRYVRNSPVYYLNRITTPLIIEAGGADSAIVPYSDEVFADMNRLHKDVTYLRYGDEGHLLQAYPNLNDYWNHVMRFLDDHLKN